MADAVTSQTILDGERLFIGKFTNISAGTGEAAVKKIDVAALAANAMGLACNGLKINKIWVHTFGMSVEILWIATANVIAVTVPENQLIELDYSSFGGIPNNAGDGKTGSVAFTTVGASSGDMYTIIIEAIKTYATA